MVSCRVPNEGFDAHTIESSVLRGERLEIPSTCPAVFKELIELCWLHEPKQRPTSSDVFDKISEIINQIPKYDSENLTSPVPQLSGTFQNPVTTFQEVPKMSDPNPIFA